jgi:hypothetical protein
MAVPSIPRGHQEWKFFNVSLGHRVAVHHKLPLKGQRLVHGGLGDARAMKLAPALFVDDAAR